MPRSSARRLTCSTQIQDPELWYALRAWELGTRDTFRTEFFNISELGARALLARHPPFDARGVATDRPPPAPGPGHDGTPHLLVVGAEPLSQHFIGHVVRRWHDSGGAAQSPLRITLVDSETDTVLEHLHYRHPELKTMAAITPYSMDLRSPQFGQAAFLFDDHATSCTVTHVYVCVGDEGLALSASLLLFNRLRGIQCSDRGADGTGERVWPSCSGGAGLVEITRSSNCTCSACSRRHASRTWCCGERMRCSPVSSTRTTSAKWDGSRITRQRCRGTICHWR